MQPTDPKNRRSAMFLLRRNEKGQVAIFVALIFQVLFIFFALLINVGLLVHHKINLQHSADLAAYYGAMKQAESLNAISHINFQLRQAWKLFTWRYRVLGTFGFIKEAGAAADQVDFPFESYAVTAATRQFRYNGSAGVYGTNFSDRYRNGPAAGTAGDISNPALRCNSMAATDSSYVVDGAPIGPQDIPFFCVAHNGFNEWPAGESNCQMGCSIFSTARPIATLPSLGTTYNTPFGGNVAGSVNTAIAAVNARTGDLCARLGPTGASILSRFIVGYANESLTRTETIKILAANLSQAVERMVDIDGKSVFEGSKRTFENNLTGANFTGLTNNSFRAYNGLSNRDCAFRSGRDSGSKEFLKIVDFNFLNLFIHSCTPTGSARNFEPKSVYTATGLDPAFSDLPTSVRDIILSLLNDQNRYNVGFEKNPNCMEYYAVKAFSEPTIPFLPLSKIRLSALAVAKPFGGSVGPAYGKTWPKGNSNSAYNDNDPESKTDATLPMRTFAASGNIKESVYMQPNFSLFVGDHLGLRNLDYLAAFHSMLAVRDIGGASIGYADPSNVNMSGTLVAPNPPKWPAFANWSALEDASGDMKQYDSMATHQGPGKGMRAVEMAAIAPNQFDIAYYSIDPDFYNNYYKKIYNAFDAIKSAAGSTSAITRDNLRPDFGADDVNPTSSVASTPLNLATFSVKDQILMKNAVLDTNITFKGSPSPNRSVRGANGNKYSDVLNFLVSLQSSLLTGWTFSRFDDYTTFPNQPVNLTSNTMSFGQCLDTWNNSTTAMSNVTDQANFRTPAEVTPNNPPVPGNCVTGGRTGYSVKLITPSRVSVQNSMIENPIDQTFLNF